MGNCPPHPKLGCIIMDAGDGIGKARTATIRHPQDEMSTDSCGENIRYQAVEGLIHQDNRQTRQQSLLRASTTIVYTYYERPK